MKTAVIDYRMGNLGSVLKALAFVGAEPVIITAPKELHNFERCILPGVGNFGDGMRSLAESGFDAALRDFAAQGKWLFGICLGMQMMLESSEEAPGIAGLGLFPGAVRRFPAQGLKVPQIGWNCVRFAPGCPLGDGMPEEPYFYFVHSYFVPEAEYTAARGEYVVPFSAAIGRGHCFATQFHPEKSQKNGLKLLENFVRISGGVQ